MPKQLAAMIKQLMILNTPALHNASHDMHNADTMTLMVRFSKPSTFIPHQSLQWITHNAVPNPAKIASFPPRKHIRLTCHFSQSPDDRAQ